MKSILNPVLLTSVAVLTGCAATQTAIEHRNLESSVRMSHSIFLEPVSVSQKTVYISVKNTSSHTLEVMKPLKDAMGARGYKVVGNPQQAHYMLQANILTLEKMSKSASESALGGGYGSALAGAGTGAAIGAFSGDGRTTLAAGIAGGLVGMAADTLVQNVNYTLVADVQISERANHAVSEQFHSTLQNGSAGTVVRTSSRNSVWKPYQTRVVATANQVNLSYEKAKPRLEEGVARTLAGIF